MKREDTARARVRIARVAEERFDPCGLVAEWRWAVRGQKVGQILGVVGRLIGNDRESRSFLLRLDDADWSPIDEQQIVARPGLQPYFAECDATTSGEIRLLCILNQPTAVFELRIDLLAGF